MRYYSFGLVNIAASRTGRHREQ